MAHLLFVYGHHKRGGKFHDRLGNVRFMGTDFTAPEFTMLEILPPRLPIVVARGRTSIKGEVYALTTDQYNYYLKMENVPLFAVPKTIRTEKNKFIATILVMSPNLMINSRQFIKTYPIVSTGEYPIEKSYIPALEDGKRGV